MNKKLQAIHTTYVLQVEITASDEELAKTGECYKTLHKKVELSFLPFIGLHLAVDPIMTDADGPKYMLLSKDVNYRRGLFKIASIIYYVERSQFTLIADSLYQRDIETFHNAQELLTAFYGFHSLY